MWRLNTLNFRSEDNKVSGTDQVVLFSETIHCLSPPRCINRPYHETLWDKTLAMGGTLTSAEAPLIGIVCARDP